MKKGDILNTTRLNLREFNIEDAEFIIALTNSPNWIRFIGDKNIRSKADAINYIEESLIKSYQDNGFGLWLVALKDTNTPIGMCGLVNRDTLENIDIGFAMLPDYAGKGYGTEIASATMNYAHNLLGLKDIVGITSPQNLVSIKLLCRIGLRFEKTLALDKGDKVLLFANTDQSEDHIVLDKMTVSFFDLFTNTYGRKPQLEKIRKLFIPSGVIINTTSGIPEIYNLEGFIQPREKMLTDGSLINFKEAEIWHQTEIYENIGQRFSFYEKSGVLNGTKFETNGMKTFQFIKIQGKWKIASVAWSDEN